MRKLCQKHDSWQWEAWPHAPFKPLLCCPVWCGDQEISWLLPSLLKSSLTNVTWNNGKKIINIRPENWVYILTLLCTICVKLSKLITLCSIFLIYERWDIFSSQFTERAKWDVVCQIPAVSFLSLYPSPIREGSSSQTLKFSLCLAMSCNFLKCHIANLNFKTFILLTVLKSWFYKV